MLKKLVILAGLALSGCITIVRPCHSAPFVIMDPPVSCADQFTVTLTTYSYTAVPTTACSGRMAVVVRNPGTNSYPIVCAYGEYGTSGDAPTWAANGGVIEIAPGGYDELNITDKSKLYCYSITSAETVKGQELKPHSLGAW